MSFLEIFQPGLKHLREERERQRLNVAHPTNGADPLMEIDLDAGTARIVVPAQARSTTAAPDHQPDDNAADQADDAADQAEKPGAAH